MLKHPVGLNCFVFKPEIWEIWSFFITFSPSFTFVFILLGNVSEQTYLDFNTLKSKVSLDSQVHTATQGASLFCVFSCLYAGQVGLQVSKTVLLRYKVPTQE